MDGRKRGSTLKSINEPRSRLALRLGRGLLRAGAISLAFSANLMLGRAGTSLSLASGAISNTLEAGQASKSPSEIESVHFELYGNHIYLPVRVNGSAPLTFMLDTGASISFLTERAARALSLKIETQSERNIGTGEGRIDFGFAKGIMLQIGRVDLLAKQVAVIPSEGLESALGRRIDGILGCELFKRYVVEIDYQGRTVKLYEPSSQLYSGPGDAIPLRLRGNRPFISARAVFSGGSPIDALLVVDIGDSSALSFHTPFVKKHGLPAPGAKAIPNFTLG
ncbi:MAG TPA: retropepsin-like aspartic protease, partial [Blastocatellia bacterium]|nr:retropepsin-like aspartic protease [Blastocatellia bacterium]